MLHLWRNKLHITFWDPLSAWVVGFLTDHRDGFTNVHLNLQNRFCIQNIKFWMFSKVCPRFKVHVYSDPRTNYHHKLFQRQSWCTVSATLYPVTDKKLLRCIVPHNVHRSHLYLESNPRWMVHVILFVVASFNLVQSWRAYMHCFHSNCLPCIHICTHGLQPPIICVHVNCTTYLNGYTIHTGY